MVGGPVGPFLGQFDALDQCDGLVKTSLDRRQVVHGNRHLLQFYRRGFGLGGAVDIAGVGTGHDSGTYGLWLDTGQQSHKKNSALCIAGFQYAHGGIHGGTDVFFAGIACAHQHHPRGLDAGRAVDIQQLARLGLQIA